MSEGIVPDPRESGNPAELSLQGILSTLRDFEKLPARGWYAAPCPAHQDAGRSLLVGQTTGRIVLFCRGGCTREAVLRALGAGSRPEPDQKDHLSASSDSSRTGSGHLPSIVVTERQLREITEEALQALVHANRPPTIFRRGRVLVRLRHDPAARFETLDVPALRGILARVADWFDVVRAGPIQKLRPTWPPVDVARDILGLPAVPVPPLRGVYRTPVLLPSGEWLMRAGYDERSGLYLDLTGLEGVHHGLSVKDARRWLLEELLGDFPFVDASSRAHALALLLLPFVRPHIDGPTPLHLIEAPLRGTGKSLLADVVALVALGEPAPVLPPDASDEELGKRLTALLIAGAPIVLLDNVVHLRSPVLAAAVTASTWRGRILGRSEMVEIGPQVVWLATGNNPRLSDEVVRRTVPIRLDPGVEWPEERSGFRHPRLAAWVREHRVPLVSACVSLVDAWVKAAMPLGDRTLGKFEHWAQVMGGILAVAGVDGFLTGRERLYAEADEESQAWRAFVEAWTKAYGGQPVAVRDLVTLCRERQLLPEMWMGRSELSAQQRLGRALDQRRDRVYAGWRIRRAGTDAGGRSTYRLEPAKGQASR